MDEVPERAPKRWFKCVQYEGGLRIELPATDEPAAIAAALAHFEAGHGGEVKVGYYSWRSRVIVYDQVTLRELLDSLP